MPGYQDLEPHTRENLVSEFLTTHPGLTLTRTWNPYDPLEPTFQDGNGRITTLSGAEAYAGSSTRRGELTASIYPGSILPLLLLAIAAYLAVKA